MRLRAFPCLILLAGLSGVAITAAATAAPGPAATAPNAGFQRGGALPKWASSLAAIPATTRTDPLVLRLWEVQALGGAAPAVLVNQAIQVNDREALPAIGQYAFTYNPSYEKVRLLRVAILRGAQTLDRTASVNVRLLEREEALDAGVYGGEKSVQLLLDDVRVGDTLWITYVTEGSNPVFGTMLDRRYGLARTSPVELRRVSVLYPENDAVRWRLLQPDAVGKAAPDSPPLAPLIDKVGGMTRLRFEMRAIDAVEQESAVPGEVMTTAGIQLSQYADWQAVAQWAARLFPRAPAGPALKALAARFASAPTPIERASAALRHVQEEIRYFSVSMGENSHRPQPPDAVLKRGFGDCKDKSYLLVSLLAQMGIEAHPVLLNSATRQLAASMLPSPTLFDHAVVRIDIGGASYFVDPTRTGQRGRIDTLPAIFPDASGLLVDAASTALLTFPPDRDSAPMLELVEDLRIGDFDGDATLEARLLYRGNYAEWARRRYVGASAAQLKRETLARYEKLYPGATLLAAPSLKEADGGVFEVAARLKLPKPVSEKEGRYVIDYDSQIMDDTLAIPAKVVRQFPLALPQGAFRGRYRLNLEWPELVTAADTPTAASIDNPWLSAREEYTLRGNLVSYILDYRLKQPSVAAADVPALARAAKALNPFASGNWRVSAKTQRPAEYRGFALRDYWLMQDVQSLPDSLKAAAAETDDDNVCGTALDASRIRLAQAPADPAELLAMTALLAARPDSAAIRACRQRLAFDEGRFADVVAMAAATAPAKLAAKAADKPAAPVDNDMRIALAWAQMLKGDAGAARATIDAYVDERMAAGSLSALDAAHATALYQRSGSALPPAVRDFARLLPDGPWPRPLLALQAGVSAFDETALLAAAAAIPVPARALALEELSFFLGERRLAAGDRGGARQAFQWVIDGGNLRGLLTPLARAELAALAPPDPQVRTALSTAAAGDQAGALNLLRQAAARGVPAAQYQLAALAYGNGRGKRDIAEVLRLATLAEQGGDADAANMLGGLYLEGMDVERDLPRAHALLARAAAGGSVNAPRNLANYYLAGYPGVPRQNDAVLAWLRLGAARNDPGAQASLGAALASGGLGVKDPLQAWYWAGRGTQLGDHAAARLMAAMLRGGGAVKKNPASAARILQALADDGDVDAMMELAEMRDSGEGVPQDRRAAEQLAAKAAAAGSGEALTWQGLRLVHGTAGVTDRVKGMALIEQAANAGHAVAATTLAGLYFEGTLVPRDTVRAETALRACAQRGAAQCQSFYGIVLHFGRLLPADHAAAAEWYRKAGEQGAPVALNNLAVGSPGTELEFAL